MFDSDAEERKRYISTAKFKFDNLCTRYRFETLPSEHKSWIEGIFEQIDEIYAEVKK